MVAAGGGLDGEVDFLAGEQQVEMSDQPLGDDVVDGAAVGAREFVGGNPTSGLMGGECGELDSGLAVTTGREERLDSDSPSAGGVGLSGIGVDADSDGLAVVAGSDGGLEGVEFVLGQRSVEDLGDGLESLFEMLKSDLDVVVAPSKGTLVVGGGDPVEQIELGCVELLTEYVGESDDDGLDRVQGDALVPEISDLSDDLGLLDDDGSGDLDLDNSSVGENLVDPLDDSNGFGSNLVFGDVAEVHLTLGEFLLGIEVGIDFVGFVGISYDIGVLVEVIGGRSRHIGLALVAGPRTFGKSRHSQKRQDEDSGELHWIIKL